MQRSLECIKVTTGRRAPKLNKWLITEYDLDYCGAIGGGEFSTVSKARFGGTMVAVKTLKNIGNTREVRILFFDRGYKLFICAYAQDLEREIEIWRGLRHDHIAPFYGASTLTSPPYIVSRYMQHGNLVQYLFKMPNADRTKLVNLSRQSLMMLLIQIQRFLKSLWGCTTSTKSMLFTGIWRSARSMYFRVFMADIRFPGKYTG